MYRTPICSYGGKNCNHKTFDEVQFRPEQQTFDPHEILGEEFDFVA